MGVPRTSVLSKFHLVGEMAHGAGPSSERDPETQEQVMAEAVSHQESFRSPGRRGRSAEL